LRLGGVGPAELATLAARGDWAARVLALSALASRIRDDPDSFSPPFLPRLKHRVASRFPFLKPFVKTVGPRGISVRYPLLNRLADRVWLVRTAAALGLGECRDPLLVAPLRPLLDDPYRPVRIAAAAALAACGEGAVAPTLTGAEPAPPMIGDTQSSRDWLRSLAAAHRQVLRGWQGIPGVEAPRGEDPDSWSLFLMGEPKVQTMDPRQAEILRYAQEKEHHFNFTKPFTPGQREQNLQMLHSFLVVAENLRAPHGAHILDLGGGAAWVSDLLYKLGYRPVTLDIAQALLRVGIDRFTREHQTPRFTCGDMALLPFRDRSFEAVVVIDALHHCPDVPKAFREAHRVLAEGGQFLLAEPGDGHAESPRSRREDLEHSICEREIHLREAVSYARDAGFTSIEVIPHFVPSVRMAPAAVAAAATLPSQEWEAFRAGSRVALDEYLIQSTLGHPILVLGKGERRLDSRVPGVLEAALEAELSRDGARVFGTVRVRNAGDTLWLRGGDERGRVRLGFQLLEPDHSLLNLDFARTELPADLPPGEGVSIRVELQLPDGGAPYVLKVDMVDEHLCWFEDMGSRPLYLSL
jgi:ubiquinone/menaquinone biosynthesis C-methylase UbiE